MTWIGELWRRLRALTRARQIDRELEEEIGLHVELRVEEQIKYGVASHEARSEAHRRFGNTLLMKEMSRDVWGWRSLEYLIQDLRYGVRVLAKNPAFTAVAATALALGIGANTAIFTFADVVLRHPVALAGLERLVTIRERSADSGDYEPLAPADYLDIQAQSQSFQQLAAYEHWGASVGSRSGPEQVPGVRVTAEFFDAVGAAPAQGRAFLREDQEPGRNHVLVLSHSFWLRRFASGSEILGHTVQLDGESYTVVGIMPPRFNFPLGGQDFWTPLPIGVEERNRRDRHYVFPVGRLRAGVSLEQARSELVTIWHRLPAQYRTDDPRRTLAVRQLRDQIVGEDERQFTLFLVGVVGFVLLIACANVANLQLARGAGRTREVGLRTALGASRIRIIRQLVTESIVLSLLGGLLGLALAGWAVPLLRITMPAEISLVCDVDRIVLNVRAMFFTFLAACAAGLISGLAPALHESRADLIEVLKEASGRATSRSGQRLRGMFVVVELALSLILLINAGLMVKGFIAVATQHTNMLPEELLTFHVTLPESRYREQDQVRAFLTDAVERLHQLPAVGSAAVVTGLPYSFYDNSAKVTLDGQPAERLGQKPAAMAEAISSGYFRTMHIPILSGREFDQNDRSGSAPVAIVSRAMAERLWPGEYVIGKRLKLTFAGSWDGWITVVGVAGDTRHEVYDRTFRSTAYLPYQQVPPRAFDFVLRTSGDPMAAVNAVRSTIQQVDRNLALAQIETMAVKIRNQASALRYVAGLMIIFGLAALVLCSVGVYGLMAYAVAERRHEIGIRMALGAAPANLLKNLMRHGLMLAGVGLVFGIPAALALAKLLAGLIYGVSPWDLSIFTAAPLLLLTIAGLACYIPAHRAIKVDPQVALHHE